MKLTCLPKLPFHFSHPALIHATLVEQAYRTKELLCTTAIFPPKVTDRCNKTILELFNYICALRNMTTFVATFGLFPDVKPKGEVLDKYCPQLKFTDQYLSYGNQDYKKQFHEILAKLESTGTLSDIPNRIFGKSFVDPTKNKISLIPIMVLMFINHLKNMKEDVSINQPMLKNKTIYVGGQKAVTIGMENGKGDPVFVNKMRNLELITVRPQVGKLCDIFLMGSCLFCWHDLNTSKDKLREKLKINQDKWDNLCASNKVPQVFMKVSGPDLPVKSPASTPSKKKEKDSSNLSEAIIPVEREEANINSGDIKEDLRCLTEDILELKSGLDVKIFDRMQKSILAIGLASHLGNHDDLASLTVALEKKPDSSSQSPTQEVSTVKDDMILQLRAINKSMVVVESSIDQLKETWNWNNKKVNIDLVKSEQSIITFETKLAKRIRTLVGPVSDDGTVSDDALAKTKPVWVGEFATLIRTFIKNKWVCSLNKGSEKVVDKNLHTIALMTEETYMKEIVYQLDHAVEEEVEEASSSGEDSWE